ncbi:MAG TPA: o-succinylbenzoate synthase [Candidatus Korarchaeota archaeon]|nr:o-succinylbenzoate synthase [Candidatus Korarchaeota archaeon]
MSKRLEAYLIEMELVSAFEISSGVTKRRQGVLVRIEEDGEVGWGEAPADSKPIYSYETAETAFYVIREFLAEQALASSGPEDFLKRVSFVRGHQIAKSGVEMALWDLKAKKEGVPLWRLLGGVRDEIESGVSIGIQPTLSDLLRTVEAYLEKRYQRVKLKIKPGWDYEIVKAVRSEHPDLMLQVDANAAYRLNDWHHLKKLDELNLLMLEQPLDYDDLVDHSVLATMLRTPICLDESIKKPEDAYRAYRLGSCSIINIKPARVGGLVNTRKIHDFCDSVGMPVWIGGMLETGVGRGHQVAAATLPNVRFPNDISASDRYYEEDIVEPPWTLTSRSTIVAPDKPGIGVEVLEERIERYTLKKFSVG